MADYKPGFEYECAYCGKDCELSYYRDDEPQYCGNECASKARSKEARFDVECSFCGRQTTVDKYAYERNEHYFCDRQCWRENQKTRVKVRCEVCGKEESVTPTRAKSYRTCSRECLGNLQEETMKAEKNPNFDSGVSDTEVEEMYEDGKGLFEIKSETGLSLPTLSDRLHRLGVDVREPGYPRSVETEFGLKVRSRLEKQVAEWLHQAGYGFEYEPEIDGPYVPDFRIGDGSLIEVWGIVGNSDYDNRRNEKMKWYTNNGHNVISVYPDDVDHLEKKMPYTP